MDNIVNKATEHGPYTYNYDSLYRLTTADGGPLTAERFSYDPVGNRLTSATATNWTYNQNNELQSYNGVTFQCDLNGNTTQKSDNGTIQNFIYNEDDRLTEVKDGNGAVIATYYYDPFGRRLWKEVAGVKTHFMYADEGLIAEFDGAGSETKSYGYAPNSTWTTNPLFMKQGPGYFFYHNDHLGTPQKMTAVNGSTVWNAKYESFGKAVIDSFSSIENNLRFPGQYYDTETGIHYNYHRYYDPRTGKYLTPDPIGLSGVGNLYQYVLDSPLNRFDPKGLKSMSFRAEPEWMPREPWRDKKSDPEGWWYLPNQPLDAPGAGEAPRGGGCEWVLKEFCEEDAWCCDWDECDKVCRAMCPIIKAPSTRTVKKCMKSHWEWVLECGHKEIRPFRPKSNQVKDR